MSSGAIIAEHGQVRLVDFGCFAKLELNAEPLMFVSWNRPTAPKPAEIAHALVDRMRPAVGFGDCHLRNLRPGHYGEYFSAEDRIRIGYRQQFASEDHYAAVCIHELVHASGAASRLARESVMQWQRDSPLFAHEELVASLGTFAVCAQSGIRSEGSSSPHSWLALLGQFDEAQIRRVVMEARDAADYILG